MKNHLSLRRIILVLSIIFAFIDGFPQQGNPFLSHYRLPDGVSNQNWGFEQGNNGLMYVLNRKGIFSFDGLQWENLGVHGRPIAIAYSNQLFYCTDRGVGYFQPNADGTYTQQLLIEASENDYYYKFSKITNGLLVISPYTICRITTDPTISYDTLYTDKRPQVFISDFFEIEGNIYHVKNKALVYLNKPDGGYEMLAGLPMGIDMTFSFIHDKHAYFGTTNNRIFRFDGNRLSPYAVKDQAYLNASIPTGGMSIDSKRFVLATLNGGCLVINSNDGTTEYTLNYINGLPDDEIYSLGQDNNGGIWLSHGMGISRVDLKIPVRTYAYYQGLRGNILSGTEFNGKLYVGSSEGLFFLDEIRDYKAVSVSVKPKASTVKKTEPEPVQQPISPQEETVEQKKKGFLSRLFNRRADKTDDAPEIARTTQEVTPVSMDRELPQQKKTIYQLQSTRHTYNKVSGLQGKVRQLLKHKGKLYAATNFGLYEISAGSAELVVRNLNLTYLAVSTLDENIFLLGADDGAYIATPSKTRWNITPVIVSDNHLVVSFIQLTPDQYLLSDEFDVLLAKKVSSSKYEVEKIPIPGTEFGNPLVRWVNGEAMAFSSSGAYVFDSNTLTLSPTSTFEISSYNNIIFNQPDYTWFKSSKQWECLSASNEISLNTSFLNLLDNPNYISIENDSTMLIVNGYSQVYRIASTKADSTSKPLGIFFKSLKDKDGVILTSESIELSYSNNSLKVRISAPSYIKEGSVEFQYKISGLMESWSEWNSNPNLDFPFLPSGNYIVSIRARDILGSVSDTIEFSVQIKPPFWQTTWFYALCLVFVLILFIVIIRIRERSLRKEKEILEQKVKERTKTIEEQKEVLKKQRDDLEIYNKEILQQKEEIEAQRDEIEIQRDQIFKQNEEITQSIAYARRIQTAVMPSQEIVKGLLNEYFILFRPRDIVSGDFFWMTDNKEFIFVAAADSTGHGVPGAFMSMMGVSFLNDIVNVEGITEPNQILNNLRQKIITTLWQTGKEGESRDGMDMALCVFTKDMKKVFFAGAYNPLYLVRSGELIEYKADKMPVGVHPKQDLQFTVQLIDLQVGDNLYIFSDGFVDQFGGPDGRKFMAKPFKQLLTSIHNHPMNEQKQILEDTLDKWQAHHDQVDDVLVIGIAVR